MNPDRRREIRKAAARRAARELDAVIDDDFDGKTVADFPDTEEHAEFNAAMNRIIARLRREGAQ